MRWALGESRQNQDQLVCVITFLSASPVFFVELFSFQSALGTLHTDTASEKNLSSSMDELELRL